MAVYYVDDGGSNTSPYDTFDKAANSITSITIAAGDTVYVEVTHSETSASGYTFGFGDSDDALVKYICVDRTTASDTSTIGGSADADSVVATSIQFDTSGATPDITYKGDLYVYGVWFNSRDQHIFSQDSHQHLKECTFGLLGAGSSDRINWLGVDEGFSTLEDCHLDFRNAGHSIVCSGTGHGIIRNLQARGTHVTSTLLINAGGGGGNPTFYIEDSDLSGVIATSGALFQLPAGASTQGVRYYCNNLLLPTSGVLHSDAFADPASRVEAYNIQVSGTDTIYQSEVSDLYGTATIDVANYRTGGSTYDGTNGYSWKIVPTGNGQTIFRPFRMRLAERWIAANQVITVHLIHEGVGDGTAGDLEDDMTWIEVVAPDATYGAQGNTFSSRIAKVNGGTPADLTASTEAWTETLTGEVKQQISVTVTGCQEGVHQIYLYHATASSADVIYVCARAESAAP